MNTMNTHIVNHPMYKDSGTFFTVEYNTTDEGRDLVEVTNVEGYSVPTEVSLRALSGYTVVNREGNSYTLDVTNRNKDITAEDVVDAISQFNNTIVLKNF